MKILAIDPSVNALQLLSKNLEQFGYEVQGAIDIALARNALQTQYRPELVMVNLALCQHPHINELQSLFYEIDNPYLTLLAISEFESEAVSLRAHAMGFRGVINKPFSIEAILAEIERVATLDPEEMSFNNTTSRRSPRYRIAMEVSIEFTDEASGRTYREQTITEDIGSAGAAVLTMLDVRVGTVLAITVPRASTVTAAVVRGSFIGADRIRRLNLEIFGHQWHEIYVAESSNTVISPTGAPAPFRNNELPASEVLNDRYQIEQILGRGGLGVVYRAIDLHNGCTVAVKLLLDQSGMSAELPRQYFEREIQMLRKIRHPNIVAITDSGVTGEDQPFLVMDFVAGSTLTDRLKEDGPWSVARTLNLLRQVCPALHCMHEQQIVHRDLKPANIMIKQEQESETAILLDLGLAKMLRGDNDKSLINTITKTGMIVGTAAYISPEQCLGSSIDGRTDIFSLGIIIYELLTGRLPFKQGSISEVILARFTQLPEPLRAFNSSIPEAVDAAVMATLAREPDDRPQTTLEFLERFHYAAISAD